MNPPDVQVTVEGGVAHVRVNKPGVTVEVRDYDVDGNDDHELIWTDENGERCIRYIETCEVESSSDSPSTAGQSITPTPGA